MKQILFSFVFVFTINSQAQRWLAPSAQWNYTSHWFYPSGNINVKMGNDTTVGGHLCQTQIRSRLIGLTPLDSISYSYRSNDTVYYFRKGKFRSLLYFGLAKGDSVFIYGNGVEQSAVCYKSDSLYQYKVDSIFYLKRGLDSFKTYQLKSTSNQTGMLHPSFLTYSEKIGYHNFIYPSITCSTDPETFILCDYGDSTIPVFWSFGKGNSCLSVGINEPSSLLSNLSLSPNPANSSIAVSLPSLLIKAQDFVLYNSLGNVVLSINTDKAEFKIDSRELADGVYFLKSRNFATQKLIVLH